MFAISVECYTLLCSSDSLPESYQSYATQAELVEELDLSGSEGSLCFLAVQHGMGWPFLVIAQRYSPAGCGFNPGALIIPETGLLFVGAGERLLCYKLEPPTRLWED